MTNEQLESLVDLDIATASLTTKLLEYNRKLVGWLDEKDKMIRAIQYENQSLKSEIFRLENELREVKRRPYSVTPPEA